MTWPNSWPAPHAEPAWLRAPARPCRRCRQPADPYRYAWSAPAVSVGQYSEWSAGLLAGGGQRWHLRITLTAGSDPGDVPLSGTVGSKAALNSANAWRFTVCRTGRQPRLGG